MGGKNIKARYIFSKEIIKNLEAQILWKKDGLSFSVYKNASNFVNVTGLKSLQEVEHQRSLLEELFTEKIIVVKIDNIFFSKKDNKNIDMHSLYNHLRENENYFCNYNIELFVGMFIHCKRKTYPTILLFRTGSYTIMGGKSLDDIYESERFVKKLIEMFNK